METKIDDKVNNVEDRVQHLITNLSKFKVNYVNEKEEFKKLREVNEKLEVQLKETRELEKSHRYHLLKSREMIGNLQETVSQLLYLKREVMKLKDEIALKDAAIKTAEKDKEALNQKHRDSLSELRTSHETEISNLTTANERKIQQIQHDADTQIAQFTCAIEELQTKIKEMGESNKEKGITDRLPKSRLERKLDVYLNEFTINGVSPQILLDVQAKTFGPATKKKLQNDFRIKFKKNPPKMNRLVLEYEEKIQRHEAQHAQLQDEISRRAARAEANFEAYRRRMEELEEQLKQSKFRQNLAKTCYMSQFENKAQHTDLKLKHTESATAMKTAPENPTTMSKVQSHHSMTSGSNNQFIPHKMPAEQCDNKKGPFNITKKRKLYSDKDF